MLRADTEFGGSDNHSVMVKTADNVGKNKRKNKNRARKANAKDKSKLKHGQKGKDYSYRGTWKHKLSRARNKAQRGGLSKKEMMAKYGRFPRKNEWWGSEKDEKEWKAKWIAANPRYNGTTTK